jgi:uncharacterized protein (TIGR03083 family)
MTKSELLAALRRDQSRLDALVASLDDARLTAPSLDGGLSVKDVLAHITTWEDLCAGWLRDVARGVTPARPETKDVDGTNARAYATAKARPLADVIEASRASHAAIIDAIEALPDAELAAESRFGWPTWQMASSNSDEHYREHIEQIERWLASEGD